METVRIVRQSSFRFQRWTFYCDLPQCESRGPSFSCFKFQLMRSLFGIVWRCLEWAAPFFPPPEALSDLKAENIGSGKGRPPSLLFLHVSPDLKTVLHQAKVFSFDIGQFPYTRGNSKLMTAHLQCTVPCVVSIGFCRGSVVWRLCSSPHANLASMCSLSVALSGPL